MDEVKYGPNKEYADKVGAEDEIAEKPRQLDEVDCVASGYEWTCPDCEEINHVIAWTYEPQKCSNCGKEVRLSFPEHARD